MNADWLSVLPPLVAIGFVLWRREVIMALVLAILTSELLLQASPLSGAPGAFIATLERTAAVLTDPDNARILLFSLLIGANFSRVLEQNQFPYSGAGCILCLHIAPSS